MSILASTAGNMAFAFGAAIVSYFLIRRSRRYLAQQTGNRTSVGNVPTTKPTPELDAEVQRGQVQLHDTARELMGELDSKIAALQALTILARQASSELESSLDRHAALRATDTGDSQLSQSVKATDPVRE